MPTSKQVEVIVSVAESHRDKMPGVVKQLRAKGLHVQQVLDTIGTITGSIASQKVSSLNRIRGVAAIEPSQGYQLPDPGSDVQ